MNSVVFLAFVMVCRIRNGALRLYRLFVTVVTGVKVWFFISPWKQVKTVSVTTYTFLLQPFLR